MTTDISQPPSQPRRDDDLDPDPALTEELRQVMHPRARWPLVLTAVLVVVLALVAWGASRTVLAALWR